MMNYLKMMRIKHYIKNFLIVLPLIFGGKLFDTELLINTALGFVVFGLTSSVVYIINDIRDAPLDRQHPKKKNRPIASGAVAPGNAIVFALVLAAVAAGTCIFRGYPKMAYLYLGAYVLLNLGYSFGLKNVPIVDIAILVSGFLLRVLFGSAVTGIEISDWLYLTVISVSFYMGFGKRRGEKKTASGEKRKVLDFYSHEFLDKNMHAFLTLSIVFYSLWSIGIASAERASKHFVWTVPLMILICLKYSLDVDGDSDGDPIEVIFHDKLLIAMVIVFAAVMLTLLYA